MRRALTCFGWLGLTVFVGCAAPSETSAVGEQFDPEPPGEGVAYDERFPGADLGGKADFPNTYEIPENLPELERPEIIVSLEGLTVHLFDRATGLSRVYPTGVGKKGSNGRSYTPRGFFQTHADPSDYWFNISRRYEPTYFGGFPFLRIDAENSKGYNTYGLHGPISYTCPTEGDCDLLNRQWFLKRDFVSHGCMRMQQDDIVEMFWMTRSHGSIPVTIQGDVEVDADGQAVDIDVEPTLWAETEAIPYGDCGERPDPYTTDGRWTSRACE